MSEKNCFSLKILIAISFAGVIASLFLTWYAYPIVDRFLKYKTYLEAEYLALNAGFFEPDTLRAKKEERDLMVKILENVYFRHPEVGVYLPKKDSLDETVVRIRLDPHLETKFCTGAYHSYKEIVTGKELSIPEIDTITKRFNGEYKGTCDLYKRIFLDTVTVHFSGLLHAPSLLKFYLDTKHVLGAEEGDWKSNKPSPHSITAQKVNDKLWKLTFGCFINCPNVYYSTKGGLFGISGPTEERYFFIAEVLWKNPVHIAIEQVGWWTGIGCCPTKTQYGVKPWEIEQ